VARYERRQTRAQARLEQERRRHRARAIRRAIAIAAAAAIAVAAIVVAAIVVAGHRTNRVSGAASGSQGGVLASISGQAQGGTVGGVQCNTNEQTVYHIHAHLTVYVNGQQRIIPEGIGIPPPQQVVQTSSGPFVTSGACFYWLHTHDRTGVIHIESPTQRAYTLGQFFAIWNQPLSAGQVGPAKGNVTVFVDGHRYSGNPSGITLAAHELIQLDVGTVTPFQPFTFPSGL
jgi:hypothetical protein